MSKKVIPSKKKEIVSSGPHFLDEQQAYEFCQETAQLVKGIKTAHMMLAQRLHRIKKQELYLNTFDVWYLYLEDIGVSETIASRLITVYEKFCEQFEIPLDKIKDVEYTKLVLVKNVCETKEIAEYWVDKIIGIDGIGMPVSAIKAELKRLKNGLEEDEKCEHGDTYLVRVCRKCGESWEEYPDTTKEHTH